MTKQKHGKGIGTRQAQAPIGGHEQVEKIPRKLNKEDFSASLRGHQNPPGPPPVESEAMKKPTKNKTR